LRSLFGSIRFIIPSPPTKLNQSPLTVLSAPHDFSEPLSWEPALTRRPSWTETSIA
jgi:hypothetical protein